MVNKNKYGDPEEPKEWTRWYFPDVLETNYSDIVPPQVCDFIDKNYSASRLHFANHPIVGYALLYNGKFVWRECKPNAIDIPNIIIKEEPIEIKLEKKARRARKKATIKLRRKKR